MIHQDQAGNLWYPGQIFIRQKPYSYDIKTSDGDIYKWSGHQLKANMVSLTTAEEKAGTKLAQATHSVQALTRQPSSNEFQECV